MLLPNKKGQEEAPFELLIAVIVMGFVLIIGVMAMQNLADLKCQNEIEAQLEQLKSKLEIVINQKSPQMIDFTPKCSNAKYEKVKVQILDNQRLCADYCSSGSSLCTLLEYSNSSKGFSFKKCLNINPSTTFSLNAGSDCPDKTAEKKILVDFRDDIKGIPRSILEISQKASTESFPTICAYCRQDAGNCA